MAGYNLDEKTGIFGKLGGKLSAKILKENDTLTLKHFNMFDFVKATIIKVKDPLVSLQIDDMPQINIFPEDHLVMNYTKSGELYVIRAKIDSIDSLSPAILTVRIIVIDKMKDLRKGERFYVSLPSYLRVFGLTEPVFGVVTNISSGGMKINCNVDLMIEDTMDIIITLNANEKLNFRGKIVRKNKILQFYEYGFEIYEITEGNRRNLFHYINELMFGSL